MRIKNKLEKLSSLDPSYEIFGAGTHEYHLNAPLKENEISQFEKDHSISLPADYKLFLSEVGNGVAGPNYGLVPLQYSTFDDPGNVDSKERLNPSERFRFNSKWNLEFGDLNEVADENYFKLKDESDYYSTKWVDGAIRLSDAGCAMAINLVVNGEESGNIWIDDRGSDQGIYPLSILGKNRIRFAEWYENWLDSSIEKAMKFESPKPSINHNEKTKGFWNKLFRNSKS